MSYYFDPETDKRPIIRCSSHRAREALERLLSSAGVTGEPFSSWETGCTGGYVAIPLSLLGDAVRITGCTRASFRFKYFRCL